MGILKGIAALAYGQAGHAIVVLEALGVLNVFLER